MQPRSRPNLEEVDEEVEYMSEVEIEEDETDSGDDDEHSHLPASSDAFDLSSPRPMDPSSPSSVSTGPPSSPTPAPRTTAPFLPSLAPAQVASDSITSTILVPPSSSNVESSLHPTSTTATEPLTPNTRYRRLLEVEGVNYTSPIKGPPEIKAAKRAERSRRQQAAKATQVHQLKISVKQGNKRSRCRTLLNMAASLGLRFEDVMDFVFDPDQGQRELRWNQFFIRKGTAARVLNWWVSSKYNKSSRWQVSDWAIDYVCGLVAKEARKTTEAGELQGKKKTITPDFISSFDLNEYARRLSSEWAPIAIRIINAFTTSRHVKSHSKKRKKKMEMVKTMIALMALGEYSRDNNLVKRLLTLYLYACGAQRQTIHVLSTLGVVESYSAMLSTRMRKIRRTKKRPVPAGPSTAGTTPASTGVSLPRTVPIPPGASTSTSPAPPISTTTPLPATAPVPMDEASKIVFALGLEEGEARRIAVTGLYAIVYDNINLNFANAEQILGRHDTQENGTCATLFTLNGPATLKDLDVKKLQRRFLAAPPLSLEDILLTDSENEDLSCNLIATVLRVIIEFGGERFSAFKENMENFQPVTDLKVDPSWKTGVYPLTAWNIDESSVQGNIDVNNAIVDELELRNHPDFDKRARILAGDQLTIARLRAIESLRAGHVTGYEGFFWGIHILGLFHTKIADIHGLLLNHFGKPGSGTSDPGSLWFHNTCLDHLPITLTSLPPFRVCRDLVFVSLYARVLHCLLRVSGSASLDSYMEEYGTWEQLVGHAEMIFEEYARGDIVQDLRFQRRGELGAGATKATKGDMVFENAVLFMRDALVSREFTDAIRSNDPGRIIPILKVFALSFRGTGRVKYAYEMLFFVHHIKHIWPAGIKCIVFNNMVLNPSGKPESGVEDDLMQEHMNLLSKAKYKARGSNASWEWMYVINPCTESLRVLQSHINTTLGADIGKKHANAHLVEDIQHLMDSLQDHKVDEIIPGRVIPGEDGEVKNVVDVGLSQLLAHGPNAPLTEYNAAFKRLQKRRKMAPVTLTPVPTLDLHDLPDSLPGTIFPRTPPPPSSSGSSVRGSPSPPSHPRATSPSSAADQALANTGPTTAELTAEISEAQQDNLTMEPMVQGELQQMMDDISQGVVDETLRRESLQDVALDMDIVDSDEESDLESSGVDSDSDYVE